MSRIAKTQSIETSALGNGDLYRELQGSGDQVLVGDSSLASSCLQALLDDESENASRSIYKQIGEGEDSYRVLIATATRGA